MIYTIFAIALFLEGISSNFISINHSPFSLLFVLDTIIVLYPYAKENIKKYALIAFIYGVVYDLMYTQVLFLDGILFLIILGIIYLLNRFFSSSLLGNLLLLSLGICSYRIGSYAILCMVGYTNFHVSILIYSILDSAILNLLYGCILSYSLSLYCKKHSIIF